MIITDIINSFNEYLKSLRNEKHKEGKGFIVLHKSIIPHPTFKAYKTIEYNLWFVISSKEKYKIFDLKTTDKVLIGQEEKTLSNLDQAFLIKLYRLIGTDTFTQMITDDYKGGEE